MEKLELKHLAPYLPFKLKTFRLFHFNGEDNVFIETMDSHNFTAMFNDSRKKPVLRPLSDLSNDAVAYQIYISDHDKNMLNTGRFGCITYGLSKKLFEWHFDVFGLIPKGLAIDINTIEK